MAHDKKLSRKHVIARRGDTRGFEKEKSPESFRAIVRCNRCGGEGHRAAECVSRMPGWHRRDGQEGKKFPVIGEKLLNMKLETAILRCVIKRPHSLGPLEVNHQGSHNEWVALCVSERNCPKPG